MKRERAREKETTPTREQLKWHAIRLRNHDVSVSPFSPSFVRTETTAIRSSHTPARFPHCARAMVHFVSIQSGARPIDDPGARPDAPPLFFEGFPPADEVPPEDVSRALNVARLAVASSGTDTDTDTDSATEPEAAPPPVEDAVGGFVKVEELVPQTEWPSEDATNAHESAEQKETAGDVRAPPPPPPPPRAAPDKIDLVEEILRVDRRSAMGEGREAEPRNRAPPAEVTVEPGKPARRVKTHGGAPSREKARLNGARLRILPEPPATRARRRRKSVSLNDLASDQAKTPPREARPKPERRGARGSTPAGKGKRASPGPAKTESRRAERESRDGPSVAARRPSCAPATYAVSEPEPDTPPAPCRDSPGGTLAFAAARGAVPPPPPPPPAAPEPAARARDALRHAKTLLDESCISPAEYEAVKRECLRRILWG